MTPRRPAPPRAFDTAPGVLASAFTLARLNRLADVGPAVAEICFSLRRRWGLDCAIAEIVPEPLNEQPLLWLNASANGRVGADSDFQNWRHRAALMPNIFVPSDNGQWVGLLSAPPRDEILAARVAVFLFGDKPSQEPLEEAIFLAGLLSQTLSRLRDQEESRTAVLSENATSHDLPQWLGIDADLLWDATSDGVIHIRRVLNGRSDIASLFEGKNLASLHDVESYQPLFDILKLERQVRRCQIRFSGSSASLSPDDMKLFVSARATSNKSGANGLRFHGTLTVGTQRFSEGVSAAAALMSRSENLRVQQDENHREAEITMAGLRILLASEASREKLRRLIELIARHMGGEDVRIALPHQGGGVRLNMLDGTESEVSDKAIIAKIAADLENRSLMLYGGKGDRAHAIRSALRLNGHDVAALALPFYSKSSFLLCTSPENSRFSSEKLASAERFSFLLQHALALRDEQEQFVQAAKMSALGQMSVSIAHELRQPLNTISLAAQNLGILLDQGQVDIENFQGRVQRILKQVDRADRVIGRIRSFGRKSTATIEDVNVAEISAGARDMMEHAIANSGVAIAINVPGTLAVRGDRLQTEQVLVNLIQNAVDALTGIGTKTKTAHPRIEISASIAPENENEIAIRVEDNGPGFPESMSEKTIETFFTTKPAGKGTGLGLTICNQIVRDMGGRMGFENYDAGARITLRLPRA